MLAVENFRELLAHLTGATQEQPIGHLHDVGFVDGVNFLAAVLARIVESELGNARGAFFCNDLDGFDNAGNDFVFEADVLTFSVFADDDEVDAGPMGCQAGQILDGAKVGEEVEFFAEGYVDAFESTANGCGDGAFQRDLVALDGLVERGGNVLAVDLEGLSSCGVAFPFELDACGFENANDLLRDFGSDAVAGNECDFVRHNSAPGCLLFALSR